MDTWNVDLVAGLSNYNTGEYKGVMPLPFGYITPLYSFYVFEGPGFVIDRLFFHGHDRFIAEFASNYFHRQGNDFFQILCLTQRIG